MHWHRLHEMSDPHGLLSFARARAAGIDGRWLRRRLLDGSLVEVQRDVGRSGLTRLTWRGELAAALWSIGPPSAASGMSALALHGLDIGRSRLPVHVTVPRPRSVSLLDPTNVRVHETRTWRDEDVVAMGGLPCEIVPRALVATAARSRWDERASRGWLRDLVADAVIGGHATIEEILTQLDAAGPIIGRRRVRDAVIDLDPKAEAARSVPEVHLANLLVEAGLPRPVLGHLVHHPDHPGELLGEVDLAWPDLKRGVELDSLAHHLGVKAGTYDTTRQQRLEDLGGWRLRRFWTWQLSQHPTHVVRQTRSFLAADPE